MMGSLKWNAPFAWVMSFLEDESKGTLSSVTTTTSTEPIGSLNYGDVDEDGIVNISDVILLFRFINEDPEIQFGEKALSSANCYHPEDDELNVEDATAVIQFLAKLCMLPVHKSVGG